MVQTEPLLGATEEDWEERETRVHTASEAQKIT